MSEVIKKLYEEKEQLEQEIEIRFDKLLSEQSPHTQKIQVELNRVKQLINFFTTKQNNN